MKYKLIPSFSLKDVDEITLLSAFEWTQAIANCRRVPKHTSWWLLRSPGDNSEYVAFVDGDGDIDHTGLYVSFSDNCVRPAFRITNLKSEIGSKIIVQNTMCTVIDSCLALSDISICCHRFDGIDNDYDTSDIRKYINSHEFKSML